MPNSDSSMNSDKAFFQALHARWTDDSDVTPPPKVIRRPREKAGKSRQPPSPKTSQPSRTSTQPKDPQPIVESSKKKHVPFYCMNDSTIKRTARNAARFAVEDARKAAVAEREAKLVIAEAAKLAAEKAAKAALERAAALAAEEDLAQSQHVFEIEEPVDIGDTASNDPVLTPQPARRDRSSSKSSARGSLSPAKQRKRKRDLSPPEVIVISDGECQQASNVPSKRRKAEPKSSEMVQTPHVTGTCIQDHEQTPQERGSVSKDPPCTPDSRGARYRGSRKREALQELPVKSKRVRVVRIEEETPEKEEGSEEERAEARAWALRGADYKPTYWKGQLSEYGADTLNDAIVAARRAADPTPEASDDESTTPGIGIVQKTSCNTTAVGGTKDGCSTFQCMQPHPLDASTNNPNVRTISKLEEMAEYYERTENKWRLLAYRKAIAALKKQTAHITSKEQALAIPAIGERLAGKIEEIATTHKLRDLECALDEPNDQVLQLFRGIYGVGTRQAQAWIAQGFRTLDDLYEKASLTANQKVGVEHYDDFNSRIPRAEIEQHAEIVSRRFADINKRVKIVVAGSYRRGKPDSGDIDFLVTAPGVSMSKLRRDFFVRFVNHLTYDGYLKFALSVSDKSDGSKWHGAACLPGSTVWRRVDFLLVPEEEMGAAMLYFTGNDIFNRSIRLLASKKDMRLNQHGLFKDVFRGPGRQKMNEGALLEAASESRIFELLGVPWRRPEERNP